MTQRKFIASLAAVVLSGVAAAALAAPQTVAVTILGPGGHSNGDYGNTNALHAGARAVLLIEKTVPTAMISDMKGGVSVNAIAADCHFLVTVADDAEAAKVRKAVDEGVAAENAFRGVKPGQTRNSLQIDVRAEVKVAGS